MELKDDDRDYSHLKIGFKIVFIYCRYYVRMSRTLLLIVTLWSVCHVSRGQDVTEGVTADSDYYESSDGDSSDYYESSYQIPLLEPVVVERGDELLGEVGENIRVSEPYDIPILSDNVIPTEPEDQQETLPLIREEQGTGAEDRVEEVEEGDMCRLEAGAGAESILMEIPESRGQDHSQLSTPRQLPIMGQVSLHTISQHQDLKPMYIFTYRLVAISVWS